MAPSHHATTLRNNVKTSSTAMRKTAKRTLKCGILQYKKPYFTKRDTAIS